MSVLLPFHRYDNLLISAIDSVLDSTGVDLEIVLIDDTPLRERRSSFLPLHHSQIRYLDTTGGKGYGKALELGSQDLNGDYVALMNSDDLIKPHKFYEQILRLTESELCITQMQKIGVSGRPIPALGGSVPAHLYDPVFLALGSFGANATWMSTRKWWSDWVFFDSYSALDWRIALKAFKYSKISYIPEALYMYRTHKSQVTKNSKSFEDSKIVHESWKDFLVQYNVQPFSEEIFQIFGAPFLGARVTNFNDLESWLCEISLGVTFLNPDQRKLFNSLLKRRLLLLLQNSENWRGPAFSAVKASADEGPKLMLDYIRYLLINK